MPYRILPQRISAQAYLSCLAGVLSPVLPGLFCMNKRSLYQVIREWEYWPFHWVYGPVYFIFIGLVIRHRFRFFVSASNPTIYSGGFLMESKKKVYDLLPQGSYPQTLAFDPGVAAAELLRQATASGIGFPLVLKPDIGGRGRAVVMVKTEEELMYYVPRYTLPFLVQPWVPYNQEVGIFFVKHPEATAGKVTGVVGKSFGTVTGDGVRTMRALIAADSRLSLYADSLFPQLGERLDEVLPEGRKEILVPFGNHARGTAFYNWNHLIDDHLHAWANRLADQIDGYFYGRLDIRFDTWDALLRDERFSIIELNGAGSEPTHMYDPSRSLWYAWKEIIRHWFMLSSVSRANHRRGVPYMSLKEGIAMLRATKKYDQRLDELHRALLKKPVMEKETVV